MLNTVLEPGAATPVCFTQRHFSNTGFPSYNSNSVMQKSVVPEVTCVDCSPVEVVVWEELFPLTRRKIEAGHETESKCIKGRIHYDGIKMQNCVHSTTTYKVY